MVFKSLKYRDERSHMGDKDVECEDEEDNILLPRFSKTLLELMAGVFVREGWFSI